jgi:hypothetical protein
MRRPRWCALIAAFLMAGHCGLLTAKDVTGDWRIDDVYCATCQSLDRSDIGRILHIGIDDIDDPFAGGHCPGKVAQRERRVTRASHKDLLRKLNPKWIVPASASRTVELIALTCDGLDFTTLITLREGRLGYVNEGEIAYRLVRIDP